MNDKGERRMKALNGVFGRMIGIVFVAVVCAGCGSWPKDIIVREDKSLNDGGTWAVVEVHLIGVSKVDLPRWQGQSVSDYWSPGGMGRTPNPDTKVIRLGTGSTTVTIGKQDPIWKKWTNDGKTDMVVLADLKGVREGQAGQADPRRLVVPIKKVRYANNVQQITISVERNGVTLLTPVEPEE
jgi:hypothetical protein